MKRADKSKEYIKNLPLEMKAEMALKEAVADAIAEHKLRGHPIAIWRNGKAVLIPPEDIMVPERDPG